MLLKLIEHWLSLFSDLTLPSVPPHDAPLVPSDGRVFVWVKSSFGGISPMVIVQPGVGGVVVPLCDPVVLKPGEYGDSLAVLAARYPAPS